MINVYIRQLINYGLETGIIPPEDEVFCINRIIESLGLYEYEEPQSVEPEELEKILEGILNFAVNSGIIEDNITSRDLFDTKIMGLITPPPSVVIEKFNRLYKESPQKATEFYYEFSKDTDYIRRYRIKKDMKWTADTEYGSLDITINLSKPEKDPKAIAAAKNAPQAGYPKCMLCRESEGYSGRGNYPARGNHRIIPITINGKDWRLQYSPYVYYNEHCIVLSGEHTPMAINRDTFCKLFSFVEQFPHYFLGSNADLPIVGGSILTHDHFQGGNYTFAMAKAEIETPVTFKSFEDVKAGIVKWPMSVIRISHESSERLTDLADKVLKSWRGYTDEAAFVFAETDGTPHNTITPIARKRGNKFELDLVLRNNITTEEHPLGVYHPHAELHHIKKENIGLIEVMGLAVLPSRLKGEIAQLCDTLAKGEDVGKVPEIEKHALWIAELQKEYTFTADNTESILKKEIGKVFSKVLEHAGVFKRTEDGKAAFMRFINSVN